MKFAGAVFAMVMLAATPALSLGSNRLWCPIPQRARSRSASVSEPRYRRAATARALRTDRRQWRGGRGARSAADRDVARHRRLVRRPLRHRARACRRRLRGGGRHPYRRQLPGSDSIWPPRNPAAAYQGTDRLYAGVMAAPRRDRSSRIGMFGFSAGGFTALVAIGGTPDRTTVAPFCAAHPDDWSCRMIKERNISLPTIKQASRIRTELGPRSPHRRRRDRVAGAGLHVLGRGTFHRHGADPALARRQRRNPSATQIMLKPSMTGCR